MALLSCLSGVYMILGSLSSIHLLIVLLSLGTLLLVRAGYSIKRRDILLTSASIVLIAPIVYIKGTYFPKYLCILYVADVPEYERIYDYSGLSEMGPTFLLWCSYVLLATVTWIVERRWGTRMKG